MSFRRLVSTLSIRQSNLHPVPVLQYGQNTLDNGVPTRVDEKYTNLGYSRASDTSRLRIVWD